MARPARIPASIVGVILAGCLFLTPVLARAQTSDWPWPYKVKSWRPRPGISVTDVVQDQNGLLWLASAYGVFQFDGVVFRQIWWIPRGPSTTLLAASDKAIWVAARRIERPLPQEMDMASNEAHLGYVLNGQWVDVKPSDSVRSRYVTDMAEAKDGTVWLATARGLSTVRDGVWRKTELDGLLASEYITAIDLDDSGAFWIGTDSGLWRWKNKTPKMIEPGTVLDIASAGTRVAALFPGHSSTFDVGAEEGAIANCAVFDRARALAFDRDLSLWVADSQQLYKDCAPVVALGGVDRTSTLFGDRDGNVWEGTFGSGLRLIQKPLTHELGIEDGLPGRPVRALVQTPDRSIWASTRGGLARWQPTVRSTTSNAPDDDPGDAPWAFKTIEGPSDPGPIAQDALGNLWVGTSQSGLWFFPAGSNDAAIHVTADDGLRPGRVRALMAPPQGGLWIGWQVGGATFYPASTKTPHGLDLQAEHRTDLGPSEGMCPGPVRDIASVDGILYFATDDKVARSADGTIECVSSILANTRIEPASPSVSDAGNGETANHADPMALDDAPGGDAMLRGLPRTVFTSFVNSGGAVLASGTFDSGFTRVDPNAPPDNRGWTGNDGLFCDSIFHAVIGPGDQLWFGCHGGIGRVDPVSLISPGVEPGLPNLSFENSDGLRSIRASLGYAPGALATHNNQIWMATTLGIALIRDPQVDAQRSPDLRAVPIDVTVAGATNRWDGSIRIPGGETAFELNMMVPSFGLTNRIRLRHRLRDGGDWTQDPLVADAEGANVLPNRRIRYAGLSPGQHVLQISARDAYGRWHAPIRIPVNVAPPFYRTWPFGLAVVVLLIGLVLAAQKLTARRLASRHALIEQERARMARDLHDELSQGLASVGLHLQAAIDVSKEEKTKNVIARTQTLLDHCRQSAKRAIWNLRHVGDGALEPALRSILQGLQTQGGPKIVLRVLGEPPSDSPNLGIVAHELPFVVQESVTNAVRHAEATNITITLDYFADDQTLYLRVQDDGKGFDSTNRQMASQGHFGILGMRERARRMGATINIEAQDGTTITLRVPMAETATPQTNV